MHESRLRRKPADISTVTPPRNASPEARDDAFMAISMLN